MAGNYWIKFYVEILDDPKMATLPDRLWRRFYELCLIAGRMNELGDLPEIKQIAWILRMSEDALQADMDELAKVDLIEKTANGWIVTNFAKRQEKMSGAERTQKFREEKRREEYYCNEGVTDVKLKVTQIDKIDKITERDKREEREESEKIDSTSHFSGDSTTAWNQALGLIEPEIGHPFYETYITTLSPKALLDGRFTLSTSNKFNADLINKRAGQTIKKVLSGIYGKPIELEIRAITQ